METDTSLLEYGKSTIISIKKGIEIYKSKLREEKEKFDNGIDVLIKILTKSKEDFIYRSAQTEHKYEEISNRIEKIEKLYQIDVSEAANEINSNFCSINKEICDFLYESKNKVRKEISEGINNFPSIEKIKSLIQPSKMPKESNNDSSIIQKSLESNINETTLQSNKGFSYSNFNHPIKLEKEKQINRDTIPQNSENACINTGNTQSKYGNSEISSNKRSCFPNDDEKPNSSIGKNDFLVHNKNLKIYNKNNFYKSPTSKEKPTSEIIPAIEENQTKITESHNWNVDVESNDNNLENTQFWSQGEYYSKIENSQKANIQIEGKKCDLKSSKKLEFYNGEQNPNTEKFLNRKRGKTPDYEKFLHRFKNNLYSKIKIYKHTPSSTDSSYSPHPENNNNLSSQESEIVKKLTDEFSNTKINFNMFIEYLKNKIIQSFEFNIMNTHTVSEQIENFSLNGYLKEIKEYSTLLKIITKPEYCDVKSPLHLHLKELFDFRCSAIKNNEMYIGGICKLSLKELFNKISSESFMNFYNITNVNISLYYFFEDILNDLDDANPNYITKNLSKEDNKEKKHNQIFIKKIRTKYEILSKEIINN